MDTTMHRLQFSLPEPQAEFLAKREIEAASEKRGAASLWDISGIAEDHGTLIDEVPVSEAPELYLTGLRSRE